MPSYVIRIRWGVMLRTVIVAVLLVAAFAYTLQPLTTATAAGNWGLGFGKEGAPPTGNASREVLGKYDAFYVGDTTQKTLYLTFDAGFENGYTDSILDTLKKHQVAAAFFVVGHYVESAPTQVKRMVAEGHLVGNHTDHHYDMSKISDFAAFSKEMTALEQKYEAVVGKPMPKIYRPPQGKYSEQNLQFAKDLGYHTFFWSLAYVDWYVDDQPTKEQAFAKLIPRIHNGAILLLHSTSATNAQILDELLTRYKEMGYTFGKLTDLYETEKQPASTDAGCLCVYPQ